MRILLVNSHHRQLGGTERYYFELGKLLQANGHHVAYFSQRHLNNLTSRWEKYFVSNLDFSQNDPASFFKKVLRMFYSLESKRKMAQLLDDFRPDIVHLNNTYYYLSPSILAPIKARGIAMVMTIHDYQLITPTITFFHDGQICELTKTHRYYWAVLHRCVKGSFVASLMAVIVSYLNYWFSFYEKSIDSFIAPSKFLKQKLLEYQFRGRHVHFLPNFYSLAGQHRISSHKKKRYVLYSGRIDETKGIFFLLELAQGLPQVEFRLAGNYQNSEVKTKVLRLIKKNSLTNVKMLGFKNPSSLQKLICNSFLVIVPSLWYENLPYAVLEAYAWAKPVLSSRIGGLQEVVLSGQTGKLFIPGDIKDCRRQLLSLWRNPKLVRHMGYRAKQFLSDNFGPEDHYRQIIKIYNRALKS